MSSFAVNRARRAKASSPNGSSGTEAGGMSLRFGGGAKLLGGANSRNTLATWLFHSYHSRVIHTIHWPKILLITKRIPARRPHHPVRIQPVLPLPHLSDLLITMFIFFVIIGTRWIVNVIPILYKLLRFTVLLTLLAPASLSLFARVETIHIVVISGPVCQRTFNRRSSVRRSIRRSTRTSSGGGFR